MSTDLIIVGIVKVGFAVILGVLGAALGAMVVLRAIGLRGVTEQIKQANLGVALLLCSATAAMGIMLNRSATATFTALDLLVRGGESFPWETVLVYAIGHLLIALSTGIVVIAVGVRTFMRLTRGIDELREIRDGNIAPALMIAVLVVVVAVLVSPGLQTLLDGILPLPELGRGISISHS